MAPLHSEPAKIRPRRLGRPPAKIKKVTRAVRIPTDIDTFLIDYAQEHGVLIGDVVTQAVLHFRMKAPAQANAPARSRAASAKRDRLAAAAGGGAD